MQLNNYRIEIETDFKHTSVFIISGCTKADAFKEFIDIAFRQCGFYLHLLVNAKSIKINEVTI